MKKCSIPENAYPLDDRAAADMQSINGYLKGRHPHYRQPTMRKLYERIRGLKETP